MAEGLRLLVILTALASADPPTIPVGAPLQPADAVARALVVSPGLRASLHDLLASKAARVAQERVRRPTFRASADGVGQESFAATAVGVVRNESTQVQGGVGIDFLTDIGTTVSLEASARLEWRQVNRDPSTTMLFSIGPNYDARLELSLRQPLLRGAGSDVNLVEERSARAAEWRNVAAREEAVSQAVLDVLSSYWELWYAERARDVQSEGQRLAQQQRDEARAKLDFGTGTETDLLRFESDLASRREALRDAEQSLASARAALAEPLAAAPNALVVASQPPHLADASAVRLDSRLVEVAGASTSVRQLEADVASARESLRTARDATRLKLDLVANVGVTAVWADDALPGFTLPDDRPAFFANGGLELELPTGGSRFEAEAQAAEARVAAAEARRDAGQLEAVTALRDAQAALDASLAKVRLAARTATVAERLAGLERQSLGLGTTTPVALLDAQQEARAARLRHARAQVDAAVARHRLEHLSQRLLDRFSLRAHLEKAPR